MSTHNICFYVYLRKLSPNYHFLLTRPQFIMYEVICVTLSSAAHYTGHGILITSTCLHCLKRVKGPEHAFFEAVKAQISLHICTV